MHPIEIRHRFEGSLREVEQLYLLDDAFNAATFDALGYRREVLERAQQGDVLTRTLLLTPHRPLPAPFSALVPNGMFQITERIVYDFAAHRGTWRTVPSALASRFRAEGTLAIVADAGGVTFGLAGEAHANFPLLSGRAEKQAVTTAEAQHAGLAAAVRRRLLERTGVHVHAPL